MSYRYEQYRERPSRSPLRRLVIMLTVIVWIILLGLLLIRFVARPMITRYIEQRIGQQLPAQVLPDGAIVPSNIQPGTFPIAEADANQWIQDHRSELQGVDDVRLRFVPGEAQADVTVGGLTSTARASVQVVDGQVQIVNPVIDPPLNLVLDVQPFATLIQDRLNSDLASVGRTVTGVTIEQGQMVIAVE